MGTLIQILIYAAIAGAAWAAIHGFDLSRQKIGADRQLAQDTPIINACKVDRDTAVKANVSLQTDLARLGDDLGKQNKAVKDLADSMALQLRDKDARIAAQSARLAAYDSDAAAQRIRLAANTKGKTCNETLFNVDADLRAIARQRMRDDGTKAPSDSGNPATPARPDTGKGSLRLSQ